MKKTLLLSAALLAMGFASAQTVQDIDTNPLKMDGEYSKITAVYPRVPTTADEVLPNPSIGQNRYHWEQQGIVTPQTADFWHEDYMELKVHNPRESQYIFHFQACVKTDGASLVITLYDGDDVVTEREVEIANIDSNWNSLHDQMAFFDEDIPEGDYTVRLTFKHQNTKETTNIANLWFEAQEQITYWSLFTYVEPEEAGTIKVSPAANNYLDGTSLTVTATANSGSDEISYKFVTFRNAYDEEFTANPYTFSIVEHTDLTAVFDVINSINDIPGTVNLNTIKIGGVKEEEKAVSLDGVSYNDGAITKYLCNYQVNKTEQFILNATKAGNYTLICPTSSKQEQANIEFNIYDKAAYDADPTVAPEANFNIKAENTGNWQKFVTNKVENINLTEGKKLMTMRFTEPAANKYTANVLFMSFGIGDDFGGDTSAIDEIEAAELDAPVKAYNLQGIPVDPAVAKGILIINGKKVVK